MRAKVTLEAKLDRWWVNNSVPAIQRRILEVLGPAAGQQLNRSQLTRALIALGCTHYENRTEALLQLETAGKVRRQAYQVRRGEIWVLMRPPAKKTQVSERAQL